MLAHSVAMNKGSFHSQASAKVGSSLMQGEFGDGHPKIEVVPRRAAPKTVKRVSAQIRRKRAAASRTRSVNWARASNLIAHPADRHKARKLKHLRHANPRANFCKVNSRHCA